MRRYPSWMTREFSPDGTIRSVRALTDGLELETVCESARCPNLPECWSQRQLSFMILGERCTRSCRFCAVPSGRPPTVSRDEPDRVADAVQRLGLEHAVITSVARDDLVDEGAGHFVDVIRAVRLKNPGVTIEILVPDFHARAELIHKVVCEGKPEVFAHNIETIERLSSILRPQADYQRSLNVLAQAKKLDQGSIIKSSLMVGLGETLSEMRQSFQDLLAVGATHLTIGQYLRPDPKYLPVLEYVSPTLFNEYEQMAYSEGFAWVQSGTYVRSSYHAVDAMKELLANVRTKT